MSAGHTPGPWRVGRGGDCQMRVYPSNNNRPICVMGEGDIDAWEDCDNAEANARLIAAAPELVEVLAVIVDCFDCEAGMVTDACINAARAALAKAGL